MNPFLIQTWDKLCPTCGRISSEDMKLAGVVFIFVTKLTRIINVAAGNVVRREVEIALENGLIPSPVPATEYVRKTFTRKSPRFHGVLLRVRRIIPLN